jgi:hypothetical protein
VFTSSAARSFLPLLQVLLLLAHCLPISGEPFITPALAAGPVPLEELPIIQREEWGPGLSPIWPASDWLPTPQTPRFLVVHHTATSNTEDPLTSVRSIWHYHAVSQGWGDIRYHYLIDPQGRIYEGRYRGEQSSNIYVEGAQSMKNNDDKVAIALLGQFNPYISYPPPGDPTPQALASLTALLAAISYEAGIDPLGSTFHEGDQAQLPNIGGHRDHSPTSCPGDNLYTLLPQIREEVAAQVRELQRTRGSPRRRPGRRPTAPPPEVPTPGSFTLVYSGDLAGQLLPDERGRGGIANLVGLIDHIRITTPKPLLLLGTGALHTDPAASDAARRDRTLLGALNVAGYDAWVPGGRDLAALQTPTAGAHFSTLAANVGGESDGQPATATQPYIIRHLGNLNVAVMGLADERASVLLPAGLRFLPAVEVLQKYLPELRKQADLIIVLSHLGREADREIARNMPDCGLIVSVDGGGTAPALEQVNSSMLLAVEDGGRLLGRVNVTRDTEGVITLNAVYEPLLEVGNAQGVPPSSRIARLLDFRADAQQGHAAGVFADEHGNEGAPPWSEKLVPLAAPTPTAIALSPAGSSEMAGLAAPPTEDAFLNALLYGGSALVGIALLGLGALVIAWPNAMVSKRRSKSRKG